MVGGFLVAVAVVGTFATVRSAGEGRRQSYVVARADLPLGTRITADHLAVARLDLPPFLHRRAFRSPEAVVGGVVVGPVARGELVQASDVLRQGAGESPLGHEVSFSVESARALDGGLRQGEPVDVLVTYGSGDSASTVVVVGAARVARVRAASGVLSDGRSVVVTLVVRNGEEALAVAHAAQAGEVTLVRTNGRHRDG